MNEDKIKVFSLLCSVRFDLIELETVVIMSHENDLNKISVIYAPLLDFVKQ